MTVPAEPIIRLERVSKTYDVDRSSTGALDVVSAFSLEVRQREFVSVVGPSGCGKTTVLFMLAGLRDPSTGRIEVCGQSARDAVRAG
ncbi:MAG: ATP-binding cassette domain-containing protein, partial [bacterium]